MTDNHHKTLARTLGVLATVALVAFVTPTSANHPQSDLGKSIVFDHKAGNQYWVEVVVTGADASRVTKVEAAVGPPNNEPWTNLPKQSWGAYAASFDVGNPADVRFRATFTDGTQVVSCWFTHPAGVENCSYPPPPGNWRSSLVGDTGAGYSGESTVADIDFDDVGEVLATSEDGLYVFDKTTTGFVRSTAYTALPGQDLDLIAVGSTDRDTVQEVYTAGRYYDGTRVHDRLMWHHYSGEQWSSEVVWDFRDVNDILIANIDDDDSDELIAVTYDGQESIVYVIERSPGFFGFTEAARLPHDQTMTRAAAADADRDLDQELYVLYGIYPYEEAVLRVDRHESGYVQDKLFQGDYGTDLNGFAAGDGDNDGFAEIYLLTSGFFPADRASLQRFSVREAGWAHTTIPMGKDYHIDLELGDGNGDGFKELYSGTRQGHLAQVMWTGSAWMSRAVYQLGSGNAIGDVSLGDTDGDGKREAYGLARDWHRDTCCPTAQVIRFAPLGTTTTTSTTTTSSSTSTTGGAFDATFTGVRGNEWWEQVSVSATGGTLSKVDVRINNGAWQPLTKQSWGGWAASYRAVQGSTVQFKATSTTGATDLSDCYRWIPPANTDATKVACAGTTTTTTTTSTTSTTGSAFDATFSGVKGNDWWVQANVAANQALAGVDARVNCSGTWKPLAKQDWGGWAASFNVPAGSKVDFRARSTSGATDLSSGYIWPQATPTSGC